MSYFPELSNSDIRDAEKPLELCQRTGKLVDPTVLSRPACSKQGHLLWDGWRPPSPELPWGAPGCFWSCLPLGFSEGPFRTRQLRLTESGVALWFGSGLLQGQLQRAAAAGGGRSASLGLERGHLRAFSSYLLSPAHLIGGVEQNTSEPGPLYCPPPIGVPAGTFPRWSPISISTTTRQETPAKLLSLPEPHFLVGLKGK